MKKLAELSNAIIEKQKIILDGLDKLSYEELIKQMASINAIVSNLDNIRTEEEIKCNKNLADQFLNDRKMTVAKAEALMKISDAYHKYKNACNLMQCATGLYQLLSIHMRYKFATGADLCKYDSP